MAAEVAALKERRMMMSRRIALHGGLFLLMCVLQAAMPAIAAEDRGHPPQLQEERRERLRALRDEMRREHQKRLREQSLQPAEEERREMLRAWREDQERREAWRERREREGASRPVGPPPSREAGGRVDWQRLSPEERRALRRELRDAYRER
ncbi:hypothetical protein [Viridibacterium curvum]